MLESKIYLEFFLYDLELAGCVPIYEEEETAENKFSQTWSLTWSQVVKPVYHEKKDSS